MFSPRALSPSGELAQTPIPFILDTAERTLLDDLAGRILDAGADLPRYGQGMVQSVRTIVDPTADAANPICLCGGTGELLAETLAAGFRLTPPAEREAVAQAANDLAGRILLAMVPSAESVGYGEDEGAIDNVYRAGLGLPVRWSRLGEDQLGIIAREARAFAQLLNLVMRVGEEEGNGVEVAGAMHRLDERGLPPTVSFIDRATGGRPGVVGSITLVNPETFFASFTVSFLVNEKRMVRENLVDGTSLRAALIELGRARLASMR